jgi:spore germination protein GerM
MKKIFSFIILAIGLLIIGFFVLNNYIYNEKQTETIEVKLYYYNPSLDQGVGGVQCSEKGLQQVTRQIPKTITPLFDSIKLLLEGNLTEEEINMGITTEFPLDGFELLSASINNKGMATLNFSDPKGKTVGGSCRTAVLWSGIRKTAMQFETVKDVEFNPEDLFQP